jgi:hypothetical protein
VTANGNRAHPASQDRAGQATPEAAKASSPSGDHPIARKLAEARKLIERGWCQQRNRRLSWRGWKYCALGALDHVGDARLSKIALASVLPMTMPRIPPSLNIVLFNDREGRTQAEVIAAFKRAEQIVRDAQ